MGAGCFFLAIWLVIFFASSKFNQLFEPLTEKEYPLKELYSTGYVLLDSYMRMSTKRGKDGAGTVFKSKFARKLRSHLSILYDEKYVDYYMRVIYSQSITFGMLVFLLGFILYGLSGEILILIICIAMAALAVYYFMTLSEKKLQKRSEGILNDFTEIVSKLALLVNAGMIMKEAWNEVAYAGEDDVYLEMQRACDEMHNGVPETEAIRRFGLRCLLPEIKKFASTIIQGIEKGNRELAFMLQNQSDEVWDMKRQRVKREGAKANTKLMIPMFIMFIGILIMIVVPIFTNLGV